MKTDNIRVRADLADKIKEIARLKRVRTSDLCVRLFGGLVEKELAAAREAELKRLQREAK